MFAHRVVLAAFSKFFADVCREEVLWETRFKVVFVPSVISFDTLSFIVRWMYNETPKMEPLESGDAAGVDGGPRDGHAGNQDFCQNLRLAAEMLGIRDLLNYLDALVNGEVKVKEENASDFPTNKALTWKEPVGGSGQNFDQQKGINSLSFGNTDLNNSLAETDILLDSDSDPGRQGGQDRDPSPNNSDLHFPLDRGPSDRDNRLEHICHQNEMPEAKPCPVEFALTVDKSKANHAIKNSKTRNNNNRKRPRTNKNVTKSNEKINNQPTVDVSEDELITCDKCGARIPKKSAESHRWTYHGAKTSLTGKADRLVKQIKHDPEISPLIKLTNGQMIFSCSLCSFSKSRDATKKVKGKNTFERETFYMNCAKHLYQQHEIVAPNVCFPCPVEGCAMVSYLRCNRKLHQRVHQPDQIPKAPCSICGKLLKPASLRAHLIDFHRNEDEPKHPCSMCDKTFINHYYVKIHEQKHNAEKKYVCSSCGDYKTNDRQSYRHHRYREHNVVEPKGSKVHECAECDYKSPVLHYVNHHQKTAHAEGAFPCSEPNCDKTFTYMALLRRHVMSVHEGGHKAKCPECDQVFLSPGGLRYHKWRVHHIGSHGGYKDTDSPLLKKPFQCAYCHHASGLVGNLKKHHKNIHSDQVFRFVDLRNIPNIPVEHVNVG